MELKEMGKTSILRNIQIIKSTEDTKKQRKR